MLAPKMHAKTILNGKSAFSTQHDFTTIFCPTTFEGLDNICRDVEGSWGVGMLRGAGDPLT